jgi:hypothetical protein
MGFGSNNVPNVGMKSIRDYKDSKPAVKSKPVKPTKPAKACTKCGKTDVHYHKRKSACVECIKKKNKLYYEKNRARWKAYQTMQDDKHTKGMADNGTFKCSMCGVDKPCDQFYKRRRQCKPCYRIKHKIWHEKRKKAKAKATVTENH